MARKLLFPYLRDYIKISISRLYDFEFQESWYSNTAKHRFSDSLDYYIFETLYDTVCLNETDDPYKEVIGISLYNIEESNLIQELFEFFEDNFEWDMPDSYYTNNPAWPKLVNKAQEIVTLMEENEKKYDYEADRKDYDRELQENPPSKPDWMK